jgi:hypothetical protein
MEQTESTERSSAGVGGPRHKMVVRNYARRSIDVGLGAEDRGVFDDG